AIRNSHYAEMLEKIVEAAAQRRPLAAPTPGSGAKPSQNDTTFRLTAVAATAMGANPPATLASARKLLDQVERGLAAGEMNFARLKPAIELEIAIAEAEEGLAKQSDS